MVSFVYVHVSENNNCFKWIISTYFKIPMVPNGIKRKFPTKFLILLLRDYQYYPFLMIFSPNRFISKYFIHTCACIHTHTHTQTMVNWTTVESLRFMSVACISPSTLLYFWSLSKYSPEVGDGQGGLLCCNSWDRKELDSTEQMNWTELS